MLVRAGRRVAAALLLAAIVVAGIALYRAREQARGRERLREVEASASERAEVTEANEAARTAVARYRGCASSDDCQLIGLKCPLRTLAVRKDKVDVARTELNSVQSAHRCPWPEPVIDKCGPEECRPQHAECIDGECVPRE